jgi:hypothetical protein
MKVARLHIALVSGQCDCRFFLHHEHVDLGLIAR